MIDINIKVIGPNNKINELKYYDLLYFCERKVEEFISKSKENLKKFCEFRKNYNFFNPYFDFVMLKLNYILVEPFFYPNTYLLPYKDKYYILDLNDCTNYDNLINQMPNFTFDFLSANDKNICLQKKRNNINYHIGFYLDENGNFYNNDYLERHLKMARLLINQKMINDVSLCIKYVKYVDKYGLNRITDFLISELGYVEGFPSEQNILIYNSKKLSKKQIEYLFKFKSTYKTKLEDYSKIKYYK